MRVTVPRHQLILKKIHECGNIAITDLASELKVSMQTIRRDVRELEKMEQLSRYHGGVTCVPKDLDNRHDIFSDQVNLFNEKTAIADTVANIIPDDSTVFISIGTTVEMIASALACKVRMRVITDSLRVAALLYSNPNIEVMIPSGTLCASNGGIEGPNTIKSISEFRTDYTITSVGAIDDDGTLLDNNLAEVTAVKAMMANTKKIIVACDHTKFNSVASVRIGNITQCDYLVTDEQPSFELLQVLDNSKTQLIIADEEAKS